MSRRASLPGASELFRLTGSSPAFDTEPAPEPREQPRQAPSARKSSLPDNGAARRGSGRQKHDAKITVYVSGDELLAMEHARLALRGSHDLVVDRGRLVREAVAVLLADFDQHGEESVLVKRLRDGGVGDVGGLGTEQAERN
ncbi:cobyrinic acid a,c-diamide synthase [Amycolatopsis sp. CA-230715]|uniref:cobyrinic acid a,c-diamide synthase n=1 Tax=Amycolatopsis sp. CA-230715 TaxID=2745196 RepID=UPI001C0113E5|nr:cobyrinic acid a,c-diamide synthase [Amycolatopsis sp. CA-230715]QWF77128.1 hypothetical protein HUW46_00508 [Amycolatopsis sp. CA-230715]